MTNDVIIVIYDPDDGYIDRQMEEDEVLRRYVGIDENGRKYIEVEEDKLYNPINDQCECSQHSDQKHQPYQHIR